MRKSKGGRKVKESKPYGSRPIFEVQFMKWVYDWEAKVFKDRLLCPKNLTYVYNQDQFHLISEIIDGYHQRYSEQVGQDRFVWTTFACVIIKEHQVQNFSLRPDDCHINRYLYILLIVGFYLRLACSELVKEILREIITCTGNLRFMFSFLPGISVRLYSSLVWSHSSLFEDKLCRDYFSLIDGDTTSMSTQYKDVFKYSQPFLVYLVQHLTPLHSRKNPASITLRQILNKAVLPDRKYTLLTLAVHYHDEILVKSLIDLGASADLFYWDHVIGTTISAERIMIASINSIIGSRQFLLTVIHIFEELMEYMDALVSVISSYAPLIRRSVYRSIQRKANNTWSSESSTYELNREIADLWGIGFDRPFPSLQHICRIKIRQEILAADKVLLSEAVVQLPLPNKLLQYLLLQFD
ncbi:unnamed protein product [Candidula unifasciata]|uniref:SOCS box domain-containing protein n=1 Tax=Candidula unifasciata TaxID=100452 RepID=A0A8S3ZE59_9EUPU|nr:unnamed protein product [Candidula unifasciata]